MAIGSVKFFNASKGFGFIVQEIEGNDVFIDKAAVRLAGMFELEKGQRLSYEIEQDAKGALKAVKLVTVEPMIPNTPVVPSSGESPPRRSRAHIPKDASSRNSRLANSPSNSRVHHTNGKAIAATHECQRNYERYCELARNTNGDQVAREGYLQHAEHFYRMMNGAATSPNASAGYA